MGQERCSIGGWVLVQSLWGVVWIAMKPNESPALPSFGGTGRDWNPQEWKLFPSD